PPFLRTREYIIGSRIGEKCYNLMRVMSRVGKLWGICAVSPQYIGERLDLDEISYRSSHGKNTRTTEERTKTSWPQGMPSLSQPIASSRRSRERARTRTPN